MIKYDHKSVERKWSNRWQEKGTYTPNLESLEKPFYNLMMFPYPSAEGLHVGNMYAFTGADVFGRWNRMMGFDVLEPIGLDGFGIHSENYAIKVGKHPKEHARDSEKHFYDQLSMIGNGYAWDHRLETYDPNYYKWTQWLFTKMFKAGLAYKDKAQVNWCSSCKTVLADEQVIDEKCERCSTEVSKREMSSWFFRITNYADRLLENIEKIKWPEKIKIAQRNWIGKKEGVLINHKVKDSEVILTAFSAYPAWLFADTFLVIAPEHPVVSDLVRDTKYQKDVDEFVEKFKRNENPKGIKLNEKEGIFTGKVVIDPFSGKEMPVWLANFALMDFGTGIIRCSAHDLRDYDFAMKYKIDLKEVVERTDPDLPVNAHANEGKLKDSGSFTGKNISPGLISEMVDWIVKEKIGERTINYHLRDWLISRQRYWGPPIPMINCKDCGWQPVPEKDLPVILPDITDFKPKGDGTSPLSNAPDSWKKVKCPNCGKDSERELDVSDTFLDSSWYFLAYPNLGTKEWKGNESPINKEITNKWLPVNAYIGGAEHAVLHLLYSRFVTMFLKDQGYIDFDEPFPFLFGHGLIIKDGAKMSKSKGNIVNPDEYISKFGADTLRTYLMFLGPYDQGGDFRDSGIEGMQKFLNRVLSLFLDPKPAKDANQLAVMTHQTLKKVTDDVGKFRYNTAISHVMEFVNFLRDSGSSSEALAYLCQMIAPFTPFMAEEIWVEVLKQPFSVHTSKWPKYDPELSKEQQNVIIIQIDGKVRGQLELSTINPHLSDKEVQDLVKKVPNVTKWLDDKKIIKTIYVPGKIINLVIQ